MWPIERSTGANDDAKEHHTGLPRTGATHSCVGCILHILTSTTGATCQGKSQASPHAPPGVYVPPERTDSRSTLLRAPPTTTPPLFFNILPMPPLLPFPFCYPSPLVPLLPPSMCLSRSPSLQGSPIFL